jgi:hypothetical protein
VQGAERSSTEVPTVASTTMAVTCPHCEEEIEVRLETKAAVAPLVHLPFTTAEEFAHWLEASALSLEEFQQLPVYQSHRDQLEPLVRALAGSDGGEPAGVGAG